MLFVVQWSCISQTCQWAGPKLQSRPSTEALLDTFHNKSFSGLGYNKSFFWTNKEVSSSETSKAQGKFDSSINDPLKVPDNKLTLNQRGNMTSKQR